jgi:isoleucyl-tRNA synthetase
MPNSSSPPGAGALHAMIANRPDRRCHGNVNGAPMAFCIKETGLLHPRTSDTEALPLCRVELGGIEVRVDTDPFDLLGVTKPRDYGQNPDTPLRRGSTRAPPMKPKPRGSHAAQSKFPADLCYLGRLDQHGWFHSSLAFLPAR